MPALRASTALTSHATRRRREIVTLCAVSLSLLLVGAIAFGFIS